MYIVSQLANTLSPLIVLFDKTLRNTLIDASLLKISYKDYRVFT